MIDFASAFLCLESLLSSSKYQKELDLFSFQENLKNLQSLKKLLDDSLLSHRSNYEMISSSISRVSSISKLHCDAALVEKELTRQRLQNQKGRAEKRLKELVFEIFGEYAKTKIRVVRRKEFLQQDQNLKLVVAIWKLRWKRFCLKFSSDLFYRCGFKKIKDYNVIQCNLLCPEYNADEMESFLGKLKKKIGLFSSQRFDVVSVVKISFLGNSDSRVHLSNQNFQFAESIEDFHSIFISIQNWLAKASNTSLVAETRSSFCSSCSLSSLLSMSFVDWLHVSSLDPQYWDSKCGRDAVRDNVYDSVDDGQLCDFTKVFSKQHSSSLFNSRVYVCLEDPFFLKYRSVVKDCPEDLEKVADLLHSLQSLYVDSNSAPFTELSSCENMLIVEMCSRHQDDSSKFSQYVKSFPEVVKVKSKSGVYLHFACANVLLLHIVNSVRNCSIDAGINKFFVLGIKKSANNEENLDSRSVFSDLFLSPIPLSVELELSRLYFKVDCSVESKMEYKRKFPASFELLPDHARIRLTFNFGTVSKLNSTYCLMGDENNFCSVERSDLQSCYYLVQLSDVNGVYAATQSKDLTNIVTSVENRNFAQDNVVLLDLISRYYSDSLKFQFGVQTQQSLNFEQVTTIVQRKMLTGKKLKNGDIGSSVGWDLALLSNICRWRSCLCDARDESNKEKLDYLCEYHDELRCFLERMKSNGNCDIAKYLPRKVPNFSIGGIEESKKDSMTIRAASTLLQELWDGKLGQTVKSFIKRMSVNLSLKHFLDSSVIVYKTCYPTLSGRNLQAVFSAPAWTKWNNQDLFEKTVLDQNQCINLLSVILQLEGLISSEIKDFMNLNIFPTAELSIIRKEIKSFKEHQEFALQHQQHNGQKLNGAKRDSPGDDSELHLNAYEFVLAALNHEKSLCDKKFQVLSSRKKDEVSQRANMAKKIAVRNDTKGFS